MLSFEALPAKAAILRARSIPLRWGWVATPLGQALGAALGPAVCHLALFDHPSAQAQRQMMDRWPGAAWERDDAAAQAWVGAALGPRPGNLQVLLRGTPFQCAAWKALMQTRPGQTLSYSDLGLLIGRPGAARAVGRAVSTNEVAVLVPCHRVIRRSGELGAYRWGIGRKEALLAMEARWVAGGPP